MSMIKKIIVFVLLAFVITGVYNMLHFSNFGTLPDMEYKEKFKNSVNYNAAEEVFLNRRPNILKEMRKRLSYVTLAKEWFNNKGKDYIPSINLPDIKSDMNEFIKPSADIKVVWFGHSTLLLNLNNKIILIDPVFSGGVAPFEFLSPRFQKPALELEELPEVDYVLISHDHYDHLDMKSIKFLKNKNCKFIMPLGVGSHLIGWGVQSDRITELDWWQTHEVAGIEFIATPAQHFSGRGVINHDTTLWASWVLRTSDHNIYFSGDSGYDDHFTEIGDKYGPFDLAFIENGQYNEKWSEVHMLPEEGVQAYFDLKAKRYFPIHWGMFKLGFHTWYDPMVRFQKAVKDKKINLISPKLGEMVIINNDYENHTWWDDLIK